MMRTKRLLAGLWVLLTALAVTATTSSSSASAADLARFCVTDLSSDEGSCYASMEEAERVSSARPTIMVAYEFPNYNENIDGRSWIIKGDRHCSEAYDNELDKRFNTRSYSTRNISSWVTTGSCRVRFWDGHDFTGSMSALSHFYVDCRDMRTCFGQTNWDNRARSFALT